MKSVLVLLMCLLSFVSWGQFKSVSMEIDGLTCSMCSYSVEHSIKKLSFIDSVSVDLNSNVATVKIKADAKTNIGSLIKSVRDAGFSVRSLTAQFNLDVSLATDSFHFDNETFIILNPSKDKTIGGVIELKFIEKTFSEAKVYKKYKPVIEKFSSDNFTSHSYYVFLM